MSQEEHPTTQDPSPEPEASEPAQEQDAPSSDAQVDQTDSPQQDTAEPDQDAVAQTEAIDQEDTARGEDSSEQDAGAPEGAKKKKPRKRRGNSSRRGEQGPDVKPELDRLYELATKYPEVGAPLAKLAMKLGHQGISERLIKMQLDSEIQARGVEFFRVSAELARKEGRTEDVFSHVLEGIEGVQARAEQVAQDERDRLLHLIRLGFVVLLFDREDLKSAPEFTDSLVTKIPQLQSFYEEDPFYHTLLAQALWFEDREKSEAAWEQATSLRDAETTWNSRGTWYKEADRDLARAEWAYRSGLKALPTSTLLRHNLAQVIMDRAQNEGAELPQIRSWLGESEALLRQALRHARRHGMRRHINGNIERVKALQADLPRVEEPVEPPPAVGDVVRGRVRSFKNYGVFLAIGRHYSGLLHISEIAHERIQDPAQVLKMGDMIEVKVLSVEQRDGGDGLRIALSRKAILPEPEAGTQPEQSQGGKDDAQRRDRRRGHGQDRRGRGPKQNKGRGSKQSSGSRQNNSRRDDNNQNMGSLGEMLLAKLEEKQNKS